MLRKSLPLWILLSILVLALSACLPGFSTPQAEQPGQVETSAYSTISAMSTQAAFETLVAQLTQVSQPLDTAVPADTQAATDVSPTSTEAPTATATNTLEPIPTLTPIPSLTPVPSLTPMPPSPTPLPCYRLGFVKDVSVPDGATFTPNQTFVKTWRIQNTGSCTWSSDFDLLFVGGNQMGAPTAADLNATVRPGDIIDLSVTMISPNTGGDYTGKWMMRSASGVVFGYGAYADQAFWVKINVSGSSEPGEWDDAHKRDFVYNYCAATWRTEDGYLPCPSAGNDFSNGSITRTYSPVLEGGYHDDEGTIITIPNSGSSGRIVGRYPALRVRAGDTFSALVGCMNDSEDCDVTFEVQYRIEGESERTSLGTWDEEYDGDYTSIGINLDDLDGKDVEFYLMVYNNGSSRDDRAFWEAVRINR